jgi:hypothetical protein
MSALASLHERNVIDLAEVRRERAMRASCPPAAAVTMPLLVPLAWVPVWVFVPFWGATAGIGARAG